MDKFDYNALDSAFDFHEEEQKGKLRNFIMQNGLVPILKNGKLCIYKILIGNKLEELAKTLNANLSNEYIQIFLDNLTFDKKLCSNTLNDMVEYHLASKEELWLYFNLDDEHCRENFINQNALEIEEQVMIDGTHYVKTYRRENLEEILVRLCSTAISCTFKRNSKIAALIFHLRNGFIDLNFIASFLCLFLDTKNVDFSNAGTLNIVEPNQLKIRNMSFSDKESKLTIEEKIAIINEILASLDIICVYSEGEDKKLEPLIYSLLYSDFKGTIVQLAQHNSKILENEDFKKAYSKFETILTFKLTKK